MPNISGQSNGFLYNKRLGKEIDGLNNEPPQGVQLDSVISPTQTNTFVKKLLLTLTPPSTSPYAGKTYQIEMSILKKYPFGRDSVKVRFVTPILHPNVHGGTMIHEHHIFEEMEILGPMAFIKKYLEVLMDLFENPHPTCIADDALMALWKSSPNAYKNKVNSFRSGGTRKARASKRGLTRRR